MTTGPTNYFILTYNLATREVEVDEWGADDVGAAAAYTVREQQFQDHDDVEVVLVGADSLDTVKLTHSHYFIQTTSDLLEELTRELLARASEPEHG
jgi:hypothetical protein